MIHNKRMNRAIIVLGSEQTVGDAKNSLGDNEFVIVQFTDPGGDATYRVIPNHDIDDNKEVDTELKETPYRFTITLPRTTDTNTANDDALNHPRVSYLVEDSQHSPLGVFIAKGIFLGDPEGREVPSVRAIGCPECDSYAWAIKGGPTSSLTCRNPGVAHEFDRDDYRPAA